MEGNYLELLVNAFDDPVIAVTRDLRIVANNGAEQHIKYMTSCSLTLIEGDCRSCKLCTHDSRCYLKSFDQTDMLDIEGGYGLDDASLTAIASNLNNSRLVQFKPKAAGHMPGILSLDVLTGLPSMSYLKDTLKLEMSRSKLFEKKLGVVFIDIHRFNVINTTLGRDSGDHVLVVISKKVRDSLRKSDTIVRQGGDVFVVAATDLDNVQDLFIVAKRIIEAVTADLVVNGKEIRLACCLGISVFPDDSEDVNTLLKNADVALQNGKRGEKNSFSFYHEDMDKESEELLSLENRLHTAVKNGELVLHYQPQVDAVTGRLIGAEALARWDLPGHGVIQPSKFIPLAEDTGDIVEIGAWVIRQACMQARAWIDGGFPPICISVNCSIKQFRDIHLVDTIKEALEENNLPPAMFGIEITENICMDNPHKVIAILKRIAGLGIVISIDDFGTGYSSLNYLKKFPVHKLKIDRTFISNITTDESDAAIVKTVVFLAHNFGLKVVAEGVETEDHIAFLAELGCDELQGYLISKPLPEESFRNMMHVLQECVNEWL